MDEQQLECSHCRRRNVPGQLVETWFKNVSWEEAANMSMAPPERPPLDREEAKKWMAARGFEMAVEFICAECIREMRGERDEPPGVR